MELLSQKNPIIPTKLLNQTKRFQQKRKKLPGLLSMKSALFAKRILTKYGILENYKFDNAALIFLEQIAGEDKKQSNFNERIAFTVRLMLLHQNRGLVAKNISLNKKGLETTLKNHIRVNLSHILFSDRRVYTELSQIYKDNHRFDEMKRRMERYERLVYKNQMKIGKQMYKESSEQKFVTKQMKKLVELGKIQHSVEEHDFLHVLKKGSLAQKRAATEILGQTLNQIMVSSEVTNVKQRKKISENIDRLNVQIEEKNITQDLIYKKNKKIQEEQEKKEETFRLQREEELKRIRQELEYQRTVKIREEEDVYLLKKKVEEQTRQVEKLFLHQSEIKSQLEKRENRLSLQVTDRLRSELHLDRLRYGLE